MYQSQILKSIINNEQAIAHVTKLNKLNKYVFPDEENSALFSLIYDHYLKYGKIPTWNYLEDFFVIEKDNPARTAYEAVEELKESQPVDLETYPDLQINYTVRNNASNLARKFEQEIKSANISEVQDKVFDFSSSVSTIIREISSTSKSEVRAYGDHAVEEARKRYEQSKEKGGLSVSKYGIKQIDDVTGGIYRDDLIYLPGYSGQGKSTMARQVTYNQILQARNWYFLTLEVVAETTIDQFYILHSSNPDIFGWNAPRITKEDVKNGTLTPEQESFYFDKVIPDFTQNPNYGNLYIMKPQDPLYDFETSLADIMYINVAEFPIDGVTLDYPQLVRPKRKGKIEREDYNMMFAMYRQFFLSFNGGIPAIFPSQIRRDAYLKAIKDKYNSYDLSVMSDYNEQERSASQVISIIQTPAMLEAGEVQIQNLKARDSRPFKTFRIMRDGSTGAHYENKLPSSKDISEIIDTLEI